jgi:hypothetical protein
MIHFRFTQPDEGTIEKRCDRRPSEAVDGYASRSASAQKDAI